MAVPISHELATGCVAIAELWADYMESRAKIALEHQAPASTVQHWADEAVRARDVERELLSAIVKASIA